MRVLLSTLSTKCAATILQAFTIVAGNAVYTAPALMVATGGLSIPKIGATAFGHELARQFGDPHRTVPPRARSAHPLRRGARAFRRPGRHLRAWSSPAASAAFAKRCSSPIAVSAARPSCKSRPIGSRRNRSASTGRPASNCSRPCVRRTPPAIRPHKAALRMHLPARLADR